MRTNTVIVDAEMMSCYYIGQTVVLNVWAFENVNYKLSFTSLSLQLTDTLLF